MLAGPGVGDPDLLYFYGPAMLTMQRGLALAYLAESRAEHAAAADLIGDGVETLPPAVRDSEWVAWYRVQAAAARARGGDVDESAAGLRTALAIVSATDGTRTKADIVQVLRALAGQWPAHPGVMELETPFADPRKTVWRVAASAGTLRGPCERTRRWYP